MLRKMIVAITVAVVLSLLIVPSAFATYYGWWNNSLSFGTLGTTKGNYTLNGTTGGFLGHFSSSLQSGSFKAEMWRIKPMGNVRDGHWDTISCSTGTWVEKTCTTVSGYKYFYIFNANHSGETIVSNDAGYFYDVP